MNTAFQEIQSVLNDCLTNKNLNVQVKHSGSEISVVINRSANQETVNYEETAESLMAKLKSLSLPNINSVKLYGRPANTKQIEWQSTRSLATQVNKPMISSHIAFNGASNGIPPQKPKSKFQHYLEQFSHYSNVISAASLLGLLLLLGFNTLAGQKTQAVVWEYKIASVPDLAFTETMDRLGTEGWELTATRRAKDSTSDDFSYECIFKRMKK